MTKTKGLDSLNQEDRAELMAVYSGNLDIIADMGLMRAFGENLLLRGITLSDAAEKSSGIIMQAAGSANDVRQALVYEIVSVGEDCPGSLQPGLHCVPISSGLDPLHGKDSAYANCNYHDLTDVWSVTEVADKLRGNPDSPTNQRRIANGLDPV